MPSGSKADTIGRVYYNVEHGYGSIKDTYKQAIRIDPDISVKDVQDFMKKQELHQLKGTKGSNSFIPKKALHEIQADLMDFTKSAEVNQGYRYGFVAIDVFSKYIHVVPVRSKQAGEITKALRKCWTRLGCQSSYIPTKRVR